MLNIGLATLISTPADSGAPRAPRIRHARTTWPRGFGLSTTRLAVTGLLVALLALFASVPATARTIISEPFTLSASHPVGTRHQGIRLLGALRLRSPVGGAPLAQLSGLAWDTDEGLLYAVSDDGYVVHLTPRFDDGVLIAAVREAHYPLQTAAGTPLDGYDADAESLALRHADNGIRGDSELVVGFESRPRVTRYSPHGGHLGRAYLPDPLDIASRYAGSNHQLEAIALDRHGHLYFVPERPLTDRGPQNHLYAETGGVWPFALSDPKHAGVTAMTATSDGDLLILERRFRSYLTPLRIELRRLHRKPASDALEVSAVAAFDGANGWRVDNFEGLARHQGERYFMISDDNDSLLQRTLLVYFELVDTGPSVPAVAASVRPGCTGACGNPAGAR